MQLNAENYKNGFLIDDEVIGGVTEMNDAGATQLFAAYISHYVTGETYAYQEFERLEGALDYLAAVKRPWAYESVGCSKKTGGCSTGGCGVKSSTAAGQAAGGCASGGCGCK